MRLIGDEEPEGADLDAIFAGLRGKYEETMHANDRWSIIA